MDKEQIAREGWKVSTVSSGAHLKRWLAEYEDMGFEVYLEKIDPAEENKEAAGCGTACTICYESGGEIPYRVYVRQKVAPNGTR